MSAALAGLVILVIGDSQMMNMLPNLHNQLEDAGAVVHSYAVCGSTAQDWIAPGTASCGTLERQDKSPAVSDQKTKPTWNVNQLIAQHHPNLVVVQLGDTMAPYGGVHVDNAWIQNQVTGLAGRIAANKVSCIWIGPTWGSDNGPYKRSVTEVQTMSHLLSTSVAPCTFVDSTTFSRPGEWQTRDGGHLEPDGYRKWAAAITASVVRLKSQAALNSH